MDKSTDFYLDFSGQPDTRGEFHFRLPTFLTLEDEEYSVSLSKLIMPSDFNLSDGCIFNLTRLDRAQAGGILFSLPPNITTLDSLKTEMNRQLDDEDVREYLECGQQNPISVSMKTGSNTLTLKGEEIANNYSFSLSTRLAAKMGLSRGRRIAPFNESSTTAANLSAGQQFFYIYSNIVKESASNEEYAPILAKHMVKRCIRNDLQSSVKYDYTNPYYHCYTGGEYRPVQSSHMDAISFTLLDEYKKPIIFNYQPQISFTLHLKKTCML